MGALLDVTRAKKYLDLYIDDEFGCDSEGYDTPNAVMGDVINQIQADYAWGVSKFVIIPAEENFVVKIPFNGEYEYNRREEKDEFCEFYTSDYCYIEYERYNNEFAGSDIQCFFAETQLVGATPAGRKIYIQEKVACDYRSGYSSRKASEDSKDAVGRMHSKYHRDYLAFEDDWLALAVECYGEEITNKMLEYVEKNIYDMHTGNYGYRFDGTPVIIDYSDFNS